MIAMRMVWVLDVKKAANELSGPFAEVGTLQADSIDSSNPSVHCHKNVFLVKSFDWNIQNSFYKLFI